MTGLMCDAIFSEFSSVKAFNVMLFEISGMASQRETMNENLLNGALKELQTSVQEIKQNRKKVCLHVWWSINLARLLIIAF